MQVQKKDGRFEDIDIQNIRKETIPACDGLGLSHEELELDADISFSDGMKTSDVQEILIKTALKKVEIDTPNWTYAAARLSLYEVYHSVKRTYFNSKVSGDAYKAITLREYCNFNKNRLSYFSKIDIFDLEVLNSHIDSLRDLQFNYFGIESLRNRYLMKTQNNIVELPQHMFMSLAMFLAQNEKEPTEWAIKFYHMMSLFEAIPATPTLSNGRKKDGSCFSCFVGSTPDNIEGIFDAYKSQALISKNGGGIGWDWTRVRAMGGIIQDYPGAAGGIVPFLKIENDIAVAVDQLSVRLGAINIFCETWHKDFLMFLDMKKNAGEESRRAKELFLSSTMSDMFMERVRDNGDWTMFDPYDVRVLTEVWGDEFKDKYIGFENTLKENPEFFTNAPVVIKAKGLMKKIIGYYWDTGMPSLSFKDTINRDHNNPELGIIRSANLCMEFLNPVTEDEIAVCNLGSINLSKINTEEDIARIAPIITRALDNVIDISGYPDDKAERTQMIRRSIGVGTAGEAEMIANMKIMYGEDEHLDVIDEVYGNIAKYVDEASIQLGKERGTWNENSEFRNAYRRCIAPTSSIAIIMDTSLSHEPVFGPIWAEENKMGIIKVTAPKINSENYPFYIDAYSVSQSKAVKATARRQKYVDMGISHNIYMSPDTTKGKDVFDIIMLAWEEGLKTTYYLRTGSKKLSASDADIDSEISVRNTKVSCFGCGG